MSIKIYNNKITNCGTGISVPKDADVAIGGNDITACNIAIELRDSPSFIEEIGLTSETPTKKLIAVLTAISNGTPNKILIKKEVQEHGLLDYLASTADASTVVNALYQLASSSLVQQAITLLTKSI